MPTMKMIPPKEITLLYIGGICTGGPALSYLSEWALLEQHLLRGRAYYRLIERPQWLYEAIGFLVLDGVGKIRVKGRRRLVMPELFSEEMQPLPPKTVAPGTQSREISLPGSSP